MPDNKVRCSINRKWFVGLMGEDPSHKKPVAIFSAAHELAHDQEFHHA